MKYTVKRSTRFKRNFKLACKRGLDVSLLKDVVNQLANDLPLDPKYKDHGLSGNWLGFRECHIQPDWLLIYLKEEDILTLTLIDTGTHSDLYKK